jgi:tricorn protease
MFAAFGTFLFPNPLTPEEMMKKLFLAISVLLVSVSPATASSGYYRYPAIHGGTIVFTAEGDLWRIGIEGGTARRLTTHHGSEIHAAISPDGSTIAFSGQYEGPTEVYTMPLGGGIPERRTFWGEYCRVVGWTPGGRVVYATRHFSTLPSTQLAIADLDKGTGEPIPLAQASEGTYDAGGNTLFFTRFSFQGSHTKRYEGGTAQNIWRFTHGEDEAVPLTADYKGTSNYPMWHQGRIYFVSDRDGTKNIWSMTEDGRDLHQHTFHSGWDVKCPDLEGGRIVYQLGADLYLYEISSDRDAMIPIRLASDFEQRRDRWIDDPADYLTSAHISPDGDRVALTARGRVFVAPVEEGRFVEATRKSGVRYRDARFMPDGESVLVLSDQTGEMEFYELPANGLGESSALTRDGTVFRFQGIPSPDGKWIAFTDKNQKLWLYEKRIEQAREITVSEQTTPYDLAWSPDSRWLAYVDEAPNYYAHIMLYSIDERKATAITGERVDSYSPAWSPDGKWLYFLSDRYFASLVRSPWGPRQPEPFFDKTTKIYHVPLTPDLRSPFRPDDEVFLARDDEDEDAGETEEDENGNGGGDDAGVKVEIEFEGLAGRTMEVPVEAGTYRDLSLTDSHLYWRESSVEQSPKQKLASLKISKDDPESKTVMEDIDGYELSLDRKKVLVTKDKSVYVFDATGGAVYDLGSHQVDLSGWTFTVDPREEWRQMLVEAWRLQRDYFYDTGLHGVDWPAVLERHLPLVDRIADRDELNDLISHMVSELSALHIYVWGGDRREGDDDIASASLGASLKRDDSAGGFRVEHIHQADPDYPDRLSPLVRPGVEIEAGEVIQEIDGVSTLSVADPAMLLKNKVGRQVLLKVKSASSPATRDVIVEPVSSRDAAELRYDEWEYTRRNRVEDLGGGDIGYVHLRAMGGGNYSEWVRNFYPVYDRRALIVDVRHNGGGNIDSWILEKLMRRAWFYWQPRTGRPYWNMHYAFRGHMVVICDEWTMSDGEAFTEGFRRLGLGKVLGTRTWGGEIWLSTSNFRLVDKGVASSAQSGVYGPEREWLIEGHGVEPDIVVDNLPHATFKGKDAQLEAAVRHLLQRIEEEPVDVPPAPGYPDKSFDYPGD